jgi:hypothetical protein
MHSCAAVYGMDEAFNLLRTAARFRCCLIWMFGSPLVFLGMVGLMDVTGPVHLQ